ncbi:50S ribosomal protein L35 [bacterium]|nr:MAG: 50S ribosomal protein L35 [bacterium]QQR61840.1 MAG: 50S ribosomal protein L35 [bacterium]QQR62578.1 MAG: 50S ribosomal protein L35 [bacterium]
MYKLKTNSAAKKRFKKTGGKKPLVKRGKGFRRHLLTHKTRKKKRQLRSSAYVSAVDTKNVLALLPYA